MSLVNGTGGADEPSSAVNVTCRHIYTNSNHTCCYNNDDTGLSRVQRACWSVEVRRTDSHRSRLLQCKRPVNGLVYSVNDSVYTAKICLHVITQAFSMLYFACKRV
jgi:hypothetical protein